MNDEIRCSNCAFYVPKKFKGTKPGTVGTCHRHPPIPIFDAGEMAADFKTTLTVSNYWCGEYAQKPRKPEEIPTGEVH